MNKKTLFIVLGIIAAVLIVFWLVKTLTDKPMVKGPTVETPTLEEPYQEPYIKGKIVSISEREVLVAEGLEGEEYDGDIEKLRGNAIWFTIDEETKIKGIEEEDFSLTDLKVGQRVEVWNIGLIMESYPAQGTALKIKLVEKEIEEKEYEEEKKEETVKECFIGGCSGELCTDDPEAMSTCEILPGMECLAEEMSCQLMEGECRWVLSEEAAVCFLAVKERHGEQVMQSRIGNLFRKAEEFLSQ